MSLPPTYRATYDDPQLWLRLGPRIEAHLAQISTVVLEHKVHTFEDYVHKMGELKALRDVLEMARSLNDPAPRETTDEDC